MSRITFASLWIFALFALSTNLLAQPGRGGFNGGGNANRIALEDLPFELGVATVPDRETFEKLSYQGPMRRDAYLSDLEFVKFIIENAMTDNATVYWMNTKNIQAHPQFMGAIGMPGGPGGRRGRGGQPETTQKEQPTGKVMRGAVTYLPRLQSDAGTAGKYIFDFQPNDRFTFAEIKFARDRIERTMPFIKGKLAFHPLDGNVAKYKEEKSLYDSSDVPVHLEQNLYGDIGYLPLNIAESFGLLRMMNNDTRPSPRDIVICKTLPNQMPRVAGVISEVRQTPLSHMNLRAIQDNVPNAFVINAMQDETIKSLVGQLVSYKVTPQGYKLRKATKDEVDAHFASLRPTKPQSPERRLTTKDITPLRQIQFADSVAFGVKAANLATMHSFEFPDATIPDGFAVPFYFYDEFMKHNHFYELVSKLLKSDEVQNDRQKQKKELKRIRSLIKAGNMPEWMTTALSKVHRSFPEGSSIRCRSSTNNEDMPNFSGAGLYDSFTHKPAEGELSKSIKQVYASMWNFRAFEERDFYRVDHMKVAMGVLLHPNYKNEKTNGVAVTDDILYETNGNYYLNTQLGEDLVTNPDEDSAPEEVLLGWYKSDGHDVVRQAGDEALLSDEQLDELRNRLARIHGRFRKLYGKTDEEPFAMEIEFKITNDGNLVIKQARPWIF